VLINHRAPVGGRVSQAFGLGADRRAQVVPNAKPSDLGLI